MLRYVATDRLLLSVLRPRCSGCFRSQYHAWLASVSSVLRERRDYKHSSHPGPVCLSSGYRCDNSHSLPSLGTHAHKQHARRTPGMMAQTVACTSNAAHISHQQLREFKNLKIVRISAWSSPRSPVVATSKNRGGSAARDHNAIVFAAGNLQRASHSVQTPAHCMPSAHPHPLRLPQHPHRVYIGSSSPPRPSTPSSSSQGFSWSPGPRQPKRISTSTSYRPHFFDTTIA